MMNVFELSAALTLDKSKYDDGLKNASGEAKSWGSKFGSAMKTAAKVGTVAMATAGTAISALATKAVKNYSEYEQLVGGMDTLFKKSSKRMQKYADDAYKTAGLSANEYMETVTSFSASLIQSVGGNTKKAGKLANQAITDMSDNANKMGTSMESIQNAYQGFAKQNYTMLDNLKLGYGGTKTEMQRLIKDASGMTKEMKAMGVSVDSTDMSFGNIVNAISVMQKHLGIAGTTAKEATTTIEGSTKSMQSAWENLVTGLAKDDVDFDGLVDNLVNTIVGEKKGEGVVNQIMPRVEKALEGVGTLISKVVPIIVKEIPKLVNEILPTLLSASSDLINGLISALPELINGLLPTIISTVETLIPTLIDTVLNMANNLLDLLPDIISQITSMLPGLLQNIFNSIIDAIPQLLDTIVGMIPQLIEAADELLQGLAEALPDMMTKFAEMLPDLITQIVELLPQVIDSIVEFISGDGLQNIIEASFAITDALIETLPEIIDTLVAALPQIIEMLTAAMPQLVEGLITLTTAVMEHWPEIMSVIIKAMPKIILSIIDALGPLTTALLDLVHVAVKNVISAIPELVKSIGKAFLKLKDLFIDIGANIGDFIGSAIKGVINGILSTLETTINNAIDFINGALSWVNKIPGVEIGKISDVTLPRLAKGGIATRSTIANVGEAGAEAILPLQNNTSWMDSFADKVANKLSNDRTYDLLKSYLPEMVNQSIVLDSGVLVGHTAKQMDKALGSIASRKARGVVV